MNQAQKRVLWFGFGALLLGSIAWSLYSKPTEQLDARPPVYVLFDLFVFAAIAFGYDFFKRHRTPWASWRQLGPITRAGVIGSAIAVASQWWISRQAAKTAGLIGVGLLSTGAWIDAKRDPTDTATSTRSRQPS
jgi:hypothetical protein